MSAGALAMVCGLQRFRTERFAREQIGTKANTVLRLAKARATAVELWLKV